MKKQRIEDMTDEQLEYAYNREVMEYQLKQTRRAEKRRKFLKVYNIIALIVFAPVLLFLLWMLVSFTLAMFMA